MQDANKREEEIAVTSKGFGLNFNKDKCKNMIIYIKTIIQNI